MTNELWAYGVIEPGGDVNALDVRDQLATFDKNRPVLLRINSPGGSVTEAVAIRSLLSAWSGGVNVMIDGLAASAASYLSTIGRSVGIARDASYMLHDAWSMQIGNASDMQFAADLLDSMSEQLTYAYAQKSGKSREAVRALMKKETWYTSAGAVDAGFADVIYDDNGIIAMNTKQASRSVAELQARLNALQRRLAIK